MGASIVCSRDHPQALVDLEVAKALNTTALEPWALHADILFKSSSREALAQLVHVCDSVVQNSQTKDAGLMRALMQRGLAYMRLGRYVAGVRADGHEWWPGQRQRGEECGCDRIGCVTRRAAVPGSSVRRTIWRKWCKSGPSTPRRRSFSSSASCF